MGDLPAHRYHAEIASATLIAALCALIAIVAATAILTVRTVRAWRTIRSFSRTAEVALEGVTRAAEAAETHAAATAARVEHLAAATDHLQRSLARLMVIRSAAGEFNAVVDRLRGAVPRK